MKTLTIKISTVKTFASMIAILFASTAFGSEVLKSYACQGEGGTLIKYNSYGEISTLTPEGKIGMSSEDGFVLEVLELGEDSSYDVRLRVSHHEEPEITILSLSLMDQFTTPFLGFFVKENGTQIKIRCL